MDGCGDDACGSGEGQLLLQQQLEDFQQEEEDGAEGAASPGWPGGGAEPEGRQDDGGGGAERGLPLEGDAQDQLFLQDILQALGELPVILTEFPQLCASEEREEVV